MLKITALIIIIASMGPAFSAKDSCAVNTYLKSTDGQEKFSQLLDRTKNLVYSKLLDFEIKETDVEIVANVPNGLNNNATRMFSVKLIKEDALYTIRGENVEIREVTSKAPLEPEALLDDVCGLEITFSGGNLQNKKTGQDYGSLGRVKEFIRLN